MHILPICSCGEHLALIIPLYEECKKCNKDIESILNDLGYHRICCRTHIMSYVSIEHEIYRLYKFNKN